MKRVFLAVFLVAGAVSVVFYLRSKPIEVERDEIKRVQVVSLTEGPDSRVFVRAVSNDGERPLASIADAIPIPLPRPGWQGLACDAQAKLVIDLVDGRTIEYGACRRSPQIQRLWNRIWSASG